MGFLDPINLLFGLSIAALIVIYLTARSRSTVEVSSLLLFEADQVPVSRLRFLKLDLLFWLEVLALATLSLAIAGLYLRMAPIPASGSAARINTAPTPSRSVVKFRQKWTP